MDDPVEKAIKGEIDDISRSIDDILVEIEDFSQTFFEPQPDEKQSTDAVRSKHV